MKLLKNINVDSSSSCTPHCIFLPCSWSELDFEDLSSSRQSIEGRLVQEYKNSSYSSDTRSELDRIVQDKECSSCSKSRTITYNSSFLHQLRWVLKRTFQNLMLNPQTSVAEVVDPHYSPRAQQWRKSIFIDLVLLLQRNVTEIASQKKVNTHSGTHSSHARHTAHSSICTKSVK